MEGEWGFSNDVVGMFSRAMQKLLKQNCYCEKMESVSSGISEKIQPTFSQPNIALIISGTTCDQNYYTIFGVIETNRIRQLKMVSTNLLRFNKRDPSFQKCLK